MSSKLSDQALKGFADASSYDTYRPSYPPEAVDALLARLQVKGVENAQIVDLGAGTGKFSQLLAARDEKYDIVAVEPHEEMRKEMEAKKLRGVRVVKGDAYDIPVESQSADAVVAAQDLECGRLYTFQHDFDDPHAESFADNAPKSWEPRTKWEATLKDIMWSYDDQQPRFRHEAWRKVFEKQLSSTPFTIQAADPLFSLPIGEDAVDFTHWLSPEVIWERFRSLSQIAVLEGEDLRRVKERALAAMGASDVDRNGKGGLPLHGRAVYAWTSSVPGAPIKEGG
ncbi:MAG: hypothetical protein Q9182_000680 [Xanthomendoza sp. 2 TL-2023]